MEYSAVACLRALDTLLLLEIALERYQAETRGEYLINSEDIASICDSLWEKQDVMIKNKGNHIDIFETRYKLKKQYGRKLRGWQREIMVQNAIRGGILPGETGATE